MTASEFFKFKSYKANTALVLLLFALAIVAGRLSGIFRYTGYRWIFSICMPLSFLLLVAALLASFANFVYMLRVISPKDTKKYYWLAASSIPLLWFIAVIIHLNIILFK